MPTRRASVRAMSQSQSPKTCVYVGFGGAPGAAFAFTRPHARVEAAGAVVRDRVVLGELVALALARHHVQELRALEAAHVLQRLDSASRLWPSTWPV